MSVRDLYEPVERTMADTVNRYELVMAAAQLARRLNSARLARPVDPDADDHESKVTTESLKMIVEEGIEWEIEEQLAGAQKE